MNPSKFKLYKVFEKNLTLSNSNSPCKDLGWPAYDSTVTHGFGPVKMTLDLFDKPSATVQKVANCPDLAALRSSTVTGGSFKPAVLSGTWYEQSYLDVAQVGAGCQRLDVTYNESTGIITAPFTATYGPAPFTIAESYEPKDEQVEPGMYTKTATPPFNLPGKNLLKIPTVVADVDDEVLILYSCLDAKLTGVKEVVIATRSKILEDGKLESIVQRAKDLGIDTSSLKAVDQTKCK